MATRRKEEQNLIHQQIHNKLVHLGYMWDILDRLHRSKTEAGLIPSLYEQITRVEFQDSEKTLVSNTEKEFSKGYKIFLDYYERTFDYLNIYLQNYLQAHPLEIWTVTGHTELGNKLSLKGQPSGLKSGTNNAPCLEFYDTEQIDTEQIFPLTCLEDIRFGTHLVKMSPLGRQGKYSH